MAGSAQVQESPSVWIVHIRVTYHPPSSEMADSWASITFAWSRPFSDMALFCGRCLSQDYVVACRRRRRSIKSLSFIQGDHLIVRRYIYIYICF